MVASCLHVLLIVTGVATITCIVVAYSSALSAMPVFCASAGPYFPVCLALPDTDAARVVQVKHL